MVKRWSDSDFIPYHSVNPYSFQTEVDSENIKYIELLKKEKEEKLTYV